MSALTSRLVVLASGKGGVGKTTLALALAAAWRDTGHAVALVDLDPQAGATLAAGVESADDPLRAGPVTVHGFQLWPAGRGLALASVEQVRQRLAAAAAGADVVVVDMAPGLSDAGHAAALPLGRPVCVVAKLDAAGLPNVAETLALGDAAGAPVRVVPTFLTTTGLSREALAYLRGRYSKAMTTTVIPSDARAAEAPGRGAPVIDTAPRSKVAGAIRALAAELLPAPLFAAAQP